MTSHSSECRPSERRYVKYRKVSHTVRRLTRSVQCDDCLKCGDYDCVGS